MTMKQLRRTKTDRVLAGVCGGFGAYFNIDSNLIRLAWIVMTLLLPPFGIILYILAWILIPEEESTLEAEYTVKEESATTAEKKT